MRRAIIIIGSAGSTGLDDVRDKDVGPLAWPARIATPEVYEKIRVRARRRRVIGDLELLLGARREWESETRDLVMVVAVMLNFGVWLKKGNGIESRPTPPEGH
jgi:hypothetical protein